MKNKLGTALLVALLVAGYPLRALADSNSLYLPGLGANATGSVSGTKRLLDVAVITSAGSGAVTSGGTYTLGDKGVFNLALSNASNTTLGPADGSYLPMTVDATGRLRVDATIVEAATAANGGTLPALTKVASGYDGTNIRVLKTDTAGVLSANVLTSALPTGAATSALQTSGNASLTSIDTKTATLVSGRVPVDGSGVTQPVSAASLPLPTGAATAAKQPALGTAGTPSADVLTVQGSASMMALKVDGSAVTQPVSAASLPLPAGAATSALQGTGNTSVASIDTKTPALGQAVMASSQPVVIASNQTAIPVTTSTTDVTASGTVTTQNLVPAGTATANSAVASGTVNGVSTATVQVTGTYTGALSLQYTVDGTNWITVGGTPFINVNTGAYSATIVSATQGIFQFEATGMAQFRITALAAVTGTATVSLRGSRAANMVSLDTSIPAGTAIIGALSANQSVNNAQINGVTPLMGNGVTGTGSQRVTIASDNTANTNPWLVSIVSPTAKTVKNAAVTAGTTAIRLTTDAAAVTAGRVYLGFRRDDASTGVCYWGTSTVTSSGATRGMYIYPGESVERSNDAGEYYVICDTAAQTFYIVEQE